MRSPHAHTPSAAATAAAELAACVQHNCHIADARHAAGMTLCTYLLQMREFYRWEHGLPLGAPLARNAVTAWMAEREALWTTLADDDYRPLPLPPEPGAASPRFADPFDVDTVNAALAPHSLLYGAGVVGGARPVFFVAELHSRGRREGLAVLQAGRERARTLLAPPAALGSGADGPIVLRRESMARWCWEHTEAHAMRPRPGTALHAMLVHYGLDRDFHAGIPRWLDDQCETAQWHEIGEHRLNRRWGGGWAELRAAVQAAAAQGSEAMATGSGGQTGHVADAAQATRIADAADTARTVALAHAARGDALIRALRDQLADLGVTLPALLARGEPGPLHAWFAGYDGLREASFPALVAGYRAWRGGQDVEGGSDSGTLLRAQCNHGLRHFETLAASLLQASPTRRDQARQALLAPGTTGAPAAMLCPWPAGARP